MNRKPRIAVIINSTRDARFGARTARLARHMLGHAASGRAIEYRTQRTQRIRRGRRKNMEWMSFASFADFLRPLRMVV